MAIGWNPMSAPLWLQAQARSKAYSDRTTVVYERAVAASGGTWEKGAGARGPGTFVSNGEPPNYPPSVVP